MLVPESCRQWSGIDGMAWEKVGYRAITCWIDASNRWSMLLVKVCGLYLCMVFREGFWVPQWVSIKAAWKICGGLSCWLSSWQQRMKFLLPSWINSSPVVVVSEALVFTGASISQAGLKLRTWIISPTFLEGHGSQWIWKPWVVQFKLGCLLFLLVWFLLLVYVFCFEVQNFSCRSALVIEKSEMAHGVPCSPGILLNAFAIGWKSCQIQLLASPNLGLTDKLLYKLQWLMTLLLHFHFYLQFNLSLSLSSASWEHFSGFFLQV